MGETESTELIALCEQILEDGEVTVEEVRRLAEWLEANEQERVAWPGNALITPLREVLADDKVNKTELRKIAALLRRTQREWVKRREAAIEKERIDAAMRAAAQLNLAGASLPAIPVTIDVTSHSRPGVVYTVDLRGPSCSCPDWTGARSRLPIGSISRCCKHVMEAFERVGPEGGWPGWFGVFLREGWRPHPEKRWTMISCSPLQALTGVGGSDWCDVFAFDCGCYRRYGFNLAEERWSYGEPPPDAERIERGIGRLASEPAPREIVVSRIPLVDEPTGGAWIALSIIGGVFTLFVAARACAPAQAPMRSFATVPTAAPVAQTTRPLPPTPAALTRDSRPKPGTRSPGAEQAREARRQRELMEQVDREFEAEERAARKGR